MIGRVVAVAGPDLPVIDREHAIGTRGVVAAVETRKAGNAEEELPPYYREDVDLGIRAVGQNVDAEPGIDEADIETGERGAAGYGHGLAGERDGLVGPRRSAD